MGTLLGNLKPTTFLWTSSPKYVMECQWFLIPFFIKSPRTRKLVSKRYYSTFTIMVVINLLLINAVFFFFFQNFVMSKVLKKCLTLLLNSYPKAWWYDAPKYCKVTWHFFPHLNCNNFTEILFLLPSLRNLFMKMSKC
jgi:hypothetical protein